MISALALVSQSADQVVACDNQSYTGGMNTQSKWTIFFIAMAVIIGPRNNESACAQEKISFNRDVRPILASKCFACHGRDEEQRQADLRLDDRSSAIESGVILPGDPEASEFVNRIFSNDEDEVMPPPEAASSLDDNQKQILKRWIAEGASYERHWAFAAPKSPAMPTSHEC